MDDTSNLTQLGSKKTEYKYSGPSVDILECFPNSFPERDYLVTHTTREFTSRCPVTDQPDFAEVCIQFVPNQLAVETKSLKLYLGSYRNEGCFMETITNRILSDLVQAMSPRRCTVTMVFSPRGGIETKVIAEYVK